MTVFKSQRSNFTGHDSTKVAIENEKEMGTIDSRSTRLDVVEANDVESGPMKVSQEPTPLDETGEIMSNLVVEAGQDDTETSGSQNCKPGSVVEKSSVIRTEESDQQQCTEQNNPLGRTEDFEQQKVETEINPAHRTVDVGTVKESESKSSGDSCPNSMSSENSNKAGSLNSKEVIESTKEGIRCI